jgi:hypothetical protein
MSLAKRFQQDIAWEYSLIDRMRVRGYVMNMQNVCMLRLFFQQCRGVNWIEPQHLQRITRDFVQHPVAQKHKITRLYRSLAAVLQFAHLITGFRSRSARSLSRS